MAPAMFRRRCFFPAETCPQASTRVYAHKVQEVFYGAEYNLGKAARDAGPLDEKTSHLIQLAAAATVRSEGRPTPMPDGPLRQGAPRMNCMYHALLPLTSTIGFPTVSAAFSWGEDVIINC
jgi:alkylhydroperoxidase/carboxymuconolactone decarboxylase family protein YurZ